VGLFFAGLPASRSCTHTLKCLYFAYQLNEIGIMKYSEFKRWLEKQGAKFTSGKGSHLHAELNGYRSIFPFHGAKEIPNP
jgi:mRNA interferase HicA